MIKAKHNPLIYGFFRWFTRISIARNFREVNINGEVDVRNHSVLLISNHVSWWDGFWALYLNMTQFGKTFHFMMDESELRKRFLFSYSGGFSITKHGKSMLESLRHVSQLLHNVHNMVLIYPQARLHSSQCRKITFKKGLDRIVTQLPESSKIVFLVQLTDYFQFPKPTLYLFIKELDTKTLSTQTLETLYQDFFDACIQQQSNICI